MSQNVILELGLHLPPEAEGTPSSFLVQQRVALDAATAGRLLERLSQVVQRRPGEPAAGGDVDLPDDTAG
jgi:hypothetical protein